MMKNILVLCFFCAVLPGIAFCQDEIEIIAQVMAINPDDDYIVIKAGENDGVEIGDGLIVHRGEEKLAEAQVIEVRSGMSAAEILNSYNEIKEGDSILIVKRSKRPKRAAQEYASGEPKKSKWATILGPGAEVESLSPGAEPLEPGEAQVTQEGGIVRADIESDLNTVFSYALIVLRENGYSVISSNRAIGNILATKPIALSLISELWADATADIGHKLVVSLDMKSDGAATELNASSFKEHTQKGKQIKSPVMRGSGYYNNLIELASKIKERAGR